MTYAPKRLAQFVAPTLETTYYTVPTATFTIVKNVVVANSYPNAVSVNLSVVPSGQLAGYENRVLPGLSIAPNSSISLDMSTVMATGDFISASATVGSVVTFTISGVEESGNALTTGGTPATSASGIQTVTSVTRPAAPYLGQVVYESDTSRLMTWSGTQWVREQPTATLAYAEVTATQASIGASRTDLTGLSVTVTVPEGRRIRITGRGHIVNDATVGAALGEIMEGTTVLGRWFREELPAASYQTMQENSVIITPSAGTHTYKLALYKNIGAGTVNMAAAVGDQAFILVEDITGSASAYVATSVPVGVLGYGSYATAAPISIPSGAYDIPNCSVNVVVPAGRQLRISSFVCHYAGAVSHETRIMADGAQLNRFYTGVPPGIVTHDWSVIDSPSAGAHTYKLQTNNGAAGTLYADGVNEAWICVEDVTPTPAPANTAPSSTLGYAESRTAQTGMTAEVDLTGLTTTVTVPAGRQLRITGSVAIRSNTAGQGAQVRIKQDNVEIQYMPITPPYADQTELLQRSVVISPSAGTHTYKLTALRTGGSNTVSVDAYSTDPNWILVEDITPASVTPYPISNGIAVATSTNRPSPPTEGMTIYEVDTDLVRIWDGSVWRSVSPRMDTPSVTPGGTTSGTSILTMGTVAVAAYNYPTRQRATAWMLLQGTVAADEYDVVIENSIAGAGSTLRGMRYNVISGTKTQTSMPHGIWYDVAANTAVTWWLKAARLGGTGTATITGDPRYSVFYIEVIPS